MKDLECLDINEGITYGSSNSKYYSSIGARNSNNQVVFEESDVSFKSGEECITELQKIIDELGYHSEDFIFACYPLNSQTMKNLEEQYLQEGRLTEEKRKESNDSENRSSPGGDNFCRIYFFLVFDGAT